MHRGTAARHEQRGTQDHGGERHDDQQVQAEQPAAPHPGGAGHAGPGTETTAIATDVAVGEDQPGVVEYIQRRAYVAVEQVVHGTDSGSGDRSRRGGPSLQCPNIGEGIGVPIGDGEVAIGSRRPVSPPIRLHTVKSARGRVN